jgi:hypothetical protein
MQIFYEFYGPTNADSTSTTVTNYIYHRNRGNTNVWGAWKRVADNTDKLPNPQALTIGSTVYTGSGAKSVGLSDLTGLGVAATSDLKRVFEIQSGNLLFEGNWYVSADTGSAVVLTAAGNARCLSIPVPKDESSDGYIDWLAASANWPTITGLGGTPDIAGGQRSIVIPYWTAVIGRHVRGGTYNQFTLYAIDYSKATSGLLQPGDIFIAGAPGDSGTRSYIQLGNGCCVDATVQLTGGVLRDTSTKQTLIAGKNDRLTVLRPPTSTGGQPQTWSPGAMKIMATNSASQLTGLAYIL